MPELLTISLHNVRFRAYHGLYPEEREKGNDFEVSLELSYSPVSGMITSLDDTIDYSVVFEMVNTVMQQPVDLLETLVQTIAAAVHLRFPHVHGITVSVTKLNPPIDGFSGNVAVKYAVVYPAG